MNWFIFALLSAVFLSASSLVEKKTLVKVHAIDFSAVLAFSNLVLSLPFLFFIDWSSVNSTSLFYLFVSAFIAAAAFYLVAKAIRHLEISLVAPLLALSPGTSSLLGFLALGEILGGIEIAGIILMIAGSYALTLEPEHGLFSPIRTFRESKYVQFVVFSLLLYSVGAVIDRTILVHFEVSVPTFIFFTHFFVALLFIPGIVAFNNRWGSVKEAFILEKRSIFWVSLFSVLFRVFSVQALSLMAVGLVSAIKRSSSFFTTLIGGELFHEKNLGRKIFASVIIIIGAVLIAI